MKKLVYEFDNIHLILEADEKELKNNNEKYVYTKSRMDTIATVIQNFFNLHKPYEFDDEDTENNVKVNEND